VRLERAGTSVAASLATVGWRRRDGSIICPAATALVGLKPTVGLVSRRGIIPISASQDTAGPMGRTVADVAALLGVLVAADDADPASARAKSHAAPDYTAFLNPGALAGKRLGLVQQALGFNADVDAAMERSVASMTAAGAIVIDVKVDGYRDWEKPEMTVLLYEFKDGINAYLKQPVSNPERRGAHHLNEEHRDTVMPGSDRSCSAGKRRVH
jgi:amidase